ncbi:uncharacterized protein MICPUCDRAFT_54872 [Micromonas pusilla CCMP1545]|uniref:Predicted protein n=1 Tax=Micromonas pusilla (strain CCMP1545) TaxID=564608 RepID=C1NAE8_MICPC|nr:uncharacterized protein MICPUCDRAFT_54872 [Micromonas pusilla CCMP1545]EEH50931.1 predicted protein [Micromonas pusilla CCMP1545]|eukprot:XP_003064951.1 predicted protein [Micromonas pusilla CCMP1545]
MPSFRLTTAREPTTPPESYPLVENLTPEKSALVERILAKSPDFATRKRKERDVPFRVTDAARVTLERNNCPRAAIDACASKEDVEKLFDDYVYAITGPQAAFLKDFGIDVSEVKTRDVASALIRKMKYKLPATEKQMREHARIYRRDNITGETPVGLTEAAASSLIHDLNNMLPITGLQRDSLMFNGLPDHEIPESFNAASAMLARFERKTPADTQQRRVAQAIRRSEGAISLTD